MAKIVPELLSPEEAREYQELLKSEATAAQAAREQGPLLDVDPSSLPAIVKTRKVVARLNLGGRDKPLAEIRQSRQEVWLSLFTLAGDKDFSQTIDQLDDLPHYFYGKPERDEKNRIMPIIRKFRYNDAECVFTLLPAQINLSEDKKDSEPSWMDFLPGAKEEILMDLLVKLACDGHCVILDGMVGVIFSLTEIQNRLKELGHSASFAEIKKSLQILRRSGRVLQKSDGSKNVEESLILSLGFSEGPGRKQEAYVRFNSDITTAIRSGAYRMINFKALMSYRSLQAKKLHKRISHVYKQLGADAPYEFLLARFLSRTGIAFIKSNPAKSCRVMEEALQEMKDKSTVVRWEWEPRREAGKICDYKFTVWPDSRFIVEVMRANKRQTKVLEGLEQARRARPGDFGVQEDRRPKPRGRKKTKG